MCSYAAQGLWIRLCNTSFFMPKPGVFLIENHSLSVEEIIDLLPGKTAKKRKLFDELSKWNVIKNDGKSFYCKRIMRDYEIRVIRKEAGSKGGNPNLVGNLDNQKSNQKPTPSSSTSFSSSSSTSKTYTLKQVQDAGFLTGLSNEQCQQYFDHYNAQGWVLGNGQPITCLNSAVAKWRNNSCRFESKKTPTSRAEARDRIKKAFANE